jgi:hypothetical protein
MDINLPLSELETFISRTSGRPVQVKGVGKNQVEVHYIVSVTLTLAEVRPHGAVFGYSTNPLVGLMIKGMKGKIREQLAAHPYLSWDEDKEQIIVDLSQLAAANNLLAHAEISALSFEDGKALIGIRPA